MAQAQLDDKDLRRPSDRYRAVQVRELWAVAERKRVDGVLGPKLSDGSDPSPGLAITSHSLAITGHSLAGMWINT